MLVVYEVGLSPADCLQLFPLHCFNIPRVKIYTMKVTTCSSLVLALVSSALAQSINELEGVGDAPQNDNATFLQASLHPNISGAVTFQPEIITSSSSAAAVANWTWQVNISTVAVNTTAPNTSPDPQVVFTQWNLQWPGAISLLQQLDGTSENPCMYAITGDFPKKVTSKWSTSDGSSCAGVFGSTCVSNILSGMRGELPASSNGCPYFPALGQVEGCAKMLGASTFVGAVGSSALSSSILSYVMSRANIIRQVSATTPTWATPATHHCGRDRASSTQRRNHFRRAIRRSTKTKSSRCRSWRWEGLSIIYCARWWTLRRRGQQRPVLRGR